MHKNTNVIIDPDVMAAIKPLIKRDGMTFSGFVRRAMMDYLESKKAKDIVIDIDSIEGLR